jgi:L-iditol 2-dehydrogenase
MRALVKYASGEGAMQVQEMPEPDLIPGHVIIEVKATGICGTDLHIQAGEYPVNPPVILGHEFSGVVSAIAPDVTETEIGKRVTSIVYFTTCGKCEFCISGQWNLCSARKSIGSGVNGAFASYVLVPARNVRTLPENIDFISGAVIEPLACCAHGVYEKSNIKPGDIVVVLGPGAIGLLTAQLAVAAGANVIMAGMTADYERMQLSQKLGTLHMVDVQKESLLELVSDVTQGRGADIVFECSGAGAAARQGLQAARRKGQFVQLGLFGKPVELDWDSIMLREIEIQNSFASTWKSWDVALKLIAQGKVQLSPLVTQVLTLSKWEEAFQQFRNHQGIKQVLLPE